MFHLLNVRWTANFRAWLAPTLALASSCAIGAGCDNETNTAAAVRCLGAKLSTLQTSIEKLSAETAKIPKGAVVPFDSTSCPIGWFDYLPAQGRFIRGIDKTAVIDPDGTRPPGALQKDQFAEHRHDRPYAVYDAGGGPNASWVASAHNLGYGHTNPPQTGPAGLGTETRPKNVSLLYCQKQ